ncbi:MAG: hypothetical protein J6Q89_07620 [Clostridia bacterium]|nr:hypothetical protein [Clostridia bacterium]
MKTRDYTIRVMAHESHAAPNLKYATDLLREIFNEEKQKDPESLSAAKNITLEIVFND